MELASIDDLEGFAALSALVTITLEEDADDELTARLAALLPIAFVVITSECCLRAVNNIYKSYMVYLNYLFLTLLAEYTINMVNIILYFKKKR